MKLHVIGVLFGFGIFATAACAPSVVTDEGNTDQSSADSTAPETTGICAGGRFHCYALRVVPTQRQGLTALAATGPVGLGANDLAAAYDLDTTVDPKATVAIVDAYGYKNAEADLAVYRKQYGLPACTVANGCLTIVNQEGKTSPLPKDPPSDDDWTVETALDLDLASAACPKCKILLIQADDDQGDGLYLGQAVAAKMGATVVSNSWGGAETSDDKGSDNEHYFQNLGKMGIFVAAGDSGYDDGGEGPDYPSTSAFVTAVGGTTLKKSATSTRGWTETAWSGTAKTGAGGSSCSISVPTPSFQKNIATTCKFRATTDVAAVGDPANGPAIYNAGQWQQVGGTSAASPFVAAVYALTGNGSAGPSFAYTNASAFNDVTSGKNGSCKTILCNAGKGWDGPTGNGTPNGKNLMALGSGSSTSGTSGSGTSSSGGSTSGTSGGTCAHDTCDVGAKLTSSCNSCATAICEFDPYCCKVSWDAVCVYETTAICSSHCGE